MLFRMWATVICQTNTTVHCCNPSIIQCECVCQTVKEKVPENECVGWLNRNIRESFPVLDSSGSGTAAGWLTCPWWVHGEWSPSPSRSHNVWEHRKGPAHGPSRHQRSGTRRSHLYNSAQYGSQWQTPCAKDAFKQSEASRLSPPGNTEPLNHLFMPTNTWLRFGGGGVDGHQTHK